MRTKPTLAASCLLLALLSAATACPAQEIIVTPLKKSGVYDVGGKIEWRVEVRGAAAPKQVTYVLKRGGLTVITEGILDLSSGPATLATSLDEPGTVLAEFKAKAGDDGKKEI